MTTCFLSHSHHDRVFANETYDLLSSLGVDCFIDKRCIEAGQAWPDALERALHDCEWFLLVASENSAKSEWVRDEVTWALEKRRSKIIVVQIDDTKPSSINVGLSRIQKINFASNPKDSRNSLVRLFVDLVYQPTRRSDLVEGSWKVRIDQHEGPDGQPLSYDGALEIASRRNEIGGKLVVSAPKSLVKSHELAFDQIDFRIDGGFCFDRFVAINYSPRDPAYIQFGSFILKLHSIPDKMMGKFVGYGAVSDRIISGEVTCKRENVQEGN